MRDKFIKSVVFLIGALVVSLYFYNLTNKEGFSPGTFPKSVDKAILDDYPLIGKNETSNNNYNQIWWHYPIFALGSYEQITNNLQHRYNPDDGTCVRADFCGAVYEDSKTKTNIITPLSPAEEGSGARVGYFRTEPNELYYSIPTNENILY